MHEDAERLLVKVAQHVVRDRVLAEARFQLSLQQQLNGDLVARLGDVRVGRGRGGRRRRGGEQLEVDQAVERGARRAAAPSHFGRDIAGADRDAVDARDDFPGRVRGREADLRRRAGAGEGAGQTTDDESEEQGGAHG